MSPFLASAISYVDACEGNAPPMPITQLAGMQ